MMITPVLTLLAAASSVLAATEHVVIVGQNGTRTYTPNTVAAAVGDVILFQFQSGNHTVTESSFADPCHSNGGFKSGFQPVSDKPINLAVEVNTDKPIWIYCGQVGHCQAGMVFAINAPTTGNTFQAFLQNAENSGSSSAPSASATSASAGASYISTWTAQSTLSAGATVSVSSGPSQSAQASATTSSPAPAQTSGGASGFVKPSVIGLFLSFALSAFM